jgi:hypothetical protein
MEHQLRSPEGRRAIHAAKPALRLESDRFLGFHKAYLSRVVFAADTLTLALARYDSRLTDPAFAGSVSPSYPRRHADTPSTPSTPPRRYADTPIRRYADTPSRQVSQPLLLRC